MGRRQQNRHTAPEVPPPITVILLGGTAEGGTAEGVTAEGVTAEGGTAEGGTAEDLHLSP